VADETRGFVPVSFKDGHWMTAEGAEVPWYEVQTDLVPEADVQGALERVLSVYGVSDVVVDAFDQFRKELKQPADASSQDGG
jgi:translation elongation factor EF-1alpha